MHIEPKHRFLSVAPMLAYTDRHCRRLLRICAPHALLYTEMLTASALLHRDPAELLAFNPEEHPLALQLGGCDPTELAAAARIGAEFGYDEINLNVGCPSDRVQNGRFGACLMKQPELVAECVSTMQQAVTVPVTVKTRLGVDDYDDYAFLLKFVTTVAATGVQTFILHARKAWLNGLSPKQNRTIPPLNYERVYQLKRDFPDLNIIINGGITQVSEVATHLHHVDGVMIGRAACHEPYVLCQMAASLGQHPNAVPSRENILNVYTDYMRSQQQHVALPVMWRHLLGLFQGQSGARRWRRYLSTHGRKATNIDALFAAATAAAFIQDNSQAG